MSLSPVMLFFLFILFTLKGFSVLPEHLDGNPSTYGRAIEYRYQYDERKSNKPIVEVKYGNIDANDFNRMLVSPTIFNMKTNIRKLPAKYSVDYFAPTQHDGVKFQEGSVSSYNQWMNTIPFSHEFEQLPRFPDSKQWVTVMHTLNEPDDLMEMISYMRQQSEDIFRERFPNYPNIVTPQALAPPNLPRKPIQFDSDLYYKFN